MPRVQVPPVFVPNPIFALDIYVSCVQGEIIERVDGSLVGATRAGNGGVTFNTARVVKLTGREQYWSGSRFSAALAGGRLVLRTQQDFDNQPGGGSGGDRGR